LTPEGTANLIVADGEVTRDGVNWVHARLAVLPDGRTGWLPRSALSGWSFVDTRVVVDRADLTLTLYRDGKVEFRTPVGVGKPGTPTPAGQFYVRDRLTSYASPECGPLAFGTSARSEYETDWPAGGSSVSTAPINPPDPRARMPTDHGGIPRWALLGLAGAVLALVIMAWVVVRARRRGPQRVPRAPRHLPGGAGVPGPGGSPRRPAGCLGPQGASEITSDPAAPSITRARVPPGGPRTRRAGAAPRVAPRAS
jgi:L,D-transpeptidase catalytic domain